MEIWPLPPTEKGQANSYSSLAAEKAKKNRADADAVDVAEALAISSKALEQTAMPTYSTQGVRATIVAFACLLHAAESSVST